MVYGLFPQDLERGWMIVKSIKGSKVPPGEFLVEMYENLF